MLGCRQAPRPHRPKKVRSLLTGFASPTLADPHFVLSPENPGYSCATFPHTLSSPALRGLINLALCWSSSDPAQWPLTSLQNNRTTEQHTILNSYSLRRRKFLQLTAASRLPVVKASSTSRVREYFSLLVSDRPAPGQHSFQASP